MNEDEQVAQIKEMRELTHELDRTHGRRRLMLWPENVLTTPALDVVEHWEDPEWARRLGELLDEMKGQMIKARGIGLAAPQIGLPLRIAVIQISDAHHTFEMVNPFWVAKSNEMVVSEAEGCLSLPDWRWDIERHKTFEVAYYDREGKYCEIQGEGMLALALQHELDHLDGRLIVDHAKNVNRKLVEKRMRTLKVKLFNKRK